MTSNPASRPVVADQWPLSVVVASGMTEEEVADACLRVRAALAAVITQLAEEGLRLEVG